MTVGTLIRYVMVFARNTITRRPMARHKNVTASKVVCMPRSGSRIKPVNMTPETQPAVLIDSTRPTSLPFPQSVFLMLSNNSGNESPENSAGTNISRIQINRTTMGDSLVVAHSQAAVGKSSEARTEKALTFCIEPSRIKSVLERLLQCAR